MKTVVISQPFLFPWVGLFEQIQTADVFVHYDDVPFSKGGFVNRVQIKTARGSEWLTVPLKGRKLGQRINELLADEESNWRARHLQQLSQAYAGAPFVAEMLDLVQRVYDHSALRLSDLLILGIEESCRYFGIGQTNFCKSSELDVPGTSTDRVLAVVRYFEGTRYVTGHGARNYLDHERFAEAGIEVEYLDYRRQPYPQLHGPFDPHVSILDLIANLGRAGAAVIGSPTVSWRAFATRPHEPHGASRGSR